MVPSKRLDSVLAVLHCVLQSGGCTNGVVMESSAVAATAAEDFVVDDMTPHGGTEIESGQRGKLGITK